ncbi:hypothetical protein RHMOL_Rhmol07G0243700 [Rhododendron molle]|uniref:Uncharacterized protein n=1 Tax=Rhododendron molle TaxID=49168 RepID=A0ACC0N663_RHOML|nr:hypothetical protein RHMOL_Rhmol07G0243700 [Rhododendron molle]
MSTVVISSDRVARDMFKNHDVALAGRKTYEAMKGEYGTDGSLILEQYRLKWRTMLRLCTTEFFAKSRLNPMEEPSLFSKDLLDLKSDKGREFFHHTCKALGLVAKPNAAVLFPILRRFDPQAIRRRTQYHLKRAFEVTGGFVHERMQARAGGCGEEIRRRNYMDVLLEHGGDGVEQPLSFSQASINVTVLVSHLVLFFLPQR